MQVPPHPHTGLQTVSWLLEGEIVHRDSLGSLQRVSPRELSLMTSGRGISHSEESPDDRPPVLYGVQLWVALPDETRDTDPSSEHHTDLPVVQHGPLTATLVLDGAATVDGEPLEVGGIVQLGLGREALELSGEDSRVMVLGGIPLGEPLILWWNFVCRTGEEVAQAREDWEHGDRFGEVRGYPGPRLAAPPLGPARLMPRS
jgi:redox-sensitive bicupin YhaK (pirin superfamily)